MTTTRTNSTATLLRDGHVLIAAGGDSSADLYDAGTGSFSPTGSMTAARHFATATLLQDGRVLVAGGFGPSGNLASAELYDPQTGKFTPTGSMKYSRSHATASLLPDGRVLIVGGYPGMDMVLGNTDDPSEWGMHSPSPVPHVNSRSSAELYDPSTGTFTVTGSMKDGRMDHTATVLADGRVLVAGGIADVAYFPPLASAEIYDPSTGTFTSTGSMAQVGAFQTAALLSDGRVLVAGGGATVSKGVLTPFTPAEIFDPKTGAFTSTGSLKDDRWNVAGTLLADGRVFIVGGNNNSGVLDSAEVYDAATGQFTPAGHMAAVRIGPMVVRLADGRVLVAGGANTNANAMASAELYQP